MKNILLVASEKKDKDLVCTERVAKLMHSIGMNVYAEDKLLSRESISALAKSYARESVDAVICIGGDGTIMRASVTAAELDVPLLGINFGQVGYLAELEPDEITLLCALRDDRYRIEKRMRIKIVSETGESFYALNDAFVTNNDRMQISKINLYCDGKKVSSYRADGLIISTPTGSTAYNLSAGGPIIDPALECMVSTPVAPHSLKAKPLVFSASSVLTLEAGSDNRGDGLCVISDGIKVLTLKNSEKITVSKSEKAVKFLRLKLGENAFYNVLNKKMID